jgi:hypothetical protein
MGRGIHAATHVIIECVLHELAPLIAPASVRSYAYQLFNRKLLKDMSKGSTNKVSKLLVRLREPARLERDRRRDAPARAHRAVVGPRVDHPLRCRTVPPRQLARPGGEAHGGVGERNGARQHRARAR